MDMRSSPFHSISLLMIERCLVEEGEQWGRVVSSIEVIRDHHGHIETKRSL